MKINWGTGIFIFLVIFFILIFSFIYYTTTQKINLVEDNYYEKELKYEEQITRTHNTEAYKNLFDFHQTGNTVVMTFPKPLLEKQMEGVVHFYRPSDYEKDIIVPLELDSLGSQYFDSSIMEKGRYVIKLNWTIDSVEYYLEESIFIN